MPAGLWRWPVHSHADGQLTGLRSFRDLGGLPLEGGGVVRSGRLFRSGHFGGVTDDQVLALEALGIRQVIDLRGAPERADDRWHWPPAMDVTVHHLPINRDPQEAAARFTQRLAVEPTPDGAHRAMLDTYAGMPELFQPLLPAIFTILSAEDGLPAVVHCHAGKDRTGFLVAILLSVLGVRREAILVDFCRTAFMQDRDAAIDYFLDHFAAPGQRERFRVVAEVTTDARPEYLSAALTEIEHTHGSISVYAAQACGKYSAALDRFRSAFSS